MNSLAREGSSLGLNGTQFNSPLKVFIMLDIGKPLQSMSLQCGLKVDIYALKMLHPKNLNRVVFVNGIFSHLCREEDVKVWINETELAMKDPTITNGETFYVPRDGVWEEISFHHPKQGDWNHIGNCESDQTMAYAISSGQAITLAYYRQIGRKYVNLGEPFTSDVGQQYKIVEYRDWCMRLIPKMGNHRMEMNGKTPRMDLMKKLFRLSNLGSENG